MDRMIAIGSMLFVVLCAAPATSQGKETPKLSGRVFLPDGKPAAGVAIGDTWELGPDGMHPTAGTCFWSDAERVTDAGGNFSTRQPSGTQSLIIIAIDSARKLGATVLVTGAAFDKPVELRLQPLVPFRVRVDPSELIAIAAFPPPTTAEGAPFSLLIMSALPRASPAHGVRVYGDISTVALELPPSDYRLLVLGRNVYFEPPEFTLRDPPVDLGTIKPQMEKLARFVGKPPPPWSVTDARGVSRQVKLADYRGKVVVVEFWGVGCGICVAGSLPHLMRYVETKEGARDKLVVLAFHDPSIESLGILDQHLPGLQDKHWKGRPLPFPILLDETGQTVKDWGIWGYPTSVVIDQQGRVVLVTHASPDVERALDFLLAPMGATSSPAATQPSGR